MNPIKSELLLPILYPSLGKDVAFIRQQIYNQLRDPVFAQVAWQVSRPVKAEMDERFRVYS